MIVRRAGPDDVDTLVELMRLFYAESGFPLEHTWARSAFSRLWDEPALGCVWLAEQEGAAMGHAVLTLRYTMEHGALSGYIDDLFVRSDFRRQGAARALLSELTAECRRRGCRSMYVEVGEQNAPAINLYVEFGLHPFEDGRTLLHGAV